VRDYIELGCTPCEEDCLQVGTNEFGHIRKQVMIWERQLQRVFPESVCNIGIRTFPHEFGDYCEAVVYFMDDYEEAHGWDIESSLPEHWDDEAREENEMLMLEVKEHEVIHERD
jgi:hypothetical protein